VVPCHVKGAAVNKDPFSFSQHILLSVAPAAYISFQNQEKLRLLMPVPSFSLKGPVLIYIALKGKISASMYLYFTHRIIYRKFLRLYQKHICLLLLVRS